MEDPSIVAEAGRLLQHVCYRAALTAGWHHDENGNLRPVTPESAAVKLALIHSEISEALEGFRKGKMDDHLPHRQAAEVELADAVIRIFDLAGRHGLNLGPAIAEKLDYNRTRADHKPEARQAAGGKKF